MEPFSRRRRITRSKHVWNVAIHVLCNFLGCHKLNSLPLGPLQTSSPSTLQSSMFRRSSELFEPRSNWTRQASTVCVCRASECIECLTWADAHTQYLQCTECDCTLLPLALSAPLHLKSPPRSVYRVEVKICEQRTQTVGGKDHWTAGLQFNKTGFDQKRK